MEIEFNEDTRTLDGIINYLNNYFANFSKKGERPPFGGAENFWVLCRDNEMYRNLKKNIYIENGIFKKKTLNKK